MLRFIRNLKSEVCREEKFTAGFINNAEILWIKEAQKDLKDIKIIKSWNVTL